MSRSRHADLADSLALRPASEVEADDEVRHFDQLSDRAQRAVTAAHEGHTATIHAPSLAAVDVVVFTDYYRVE